MPKTQQSKANPVPISSAVQDCEHYVTINNEKKELEKDLKSLKSRMLAIIPEGQTKERLPAERNGAHGVYVVSRIEQDRRVIDDEALRAKLEKHNLYMRACKTVPDHEKVAELIKDGSFPAEELAECLTGAQVVYPLVEWNGK